MRERRSQLLVALLGVAERMRQVAHAVECEVLGTVRVSKGVQVVAPARGYAHKPALKAASGVLRRTHAVGELAELLLDTARARHAGELDGGVGSGMIEPLVPEVGA
eukprot:scaffold180337_cov30-Tisochrysis_lutea.AAC.1